MSGTKQLVVHEALETTMWFSGSKVSSLTPTTKVASAPVAGAETITRGAPPSRWAAALSRSVKMPVDSMTTSTPRSPQGMSAGLRSRDDLEDVAVHVDAPVDHVDLTGVGAGDRVTLEQQGHGVERARGR